MRHSEVGWDILPDKRHRNALCLLACGHCDICRGCLGYGKIFWLMMAEEKNRKTVGFEGMDELWNYPPATF